MARFLHVASFQEVALRRPQSNPTPADTKTPTNPDPEIRKIYKNMRAAFGRPHKGGGRPLFGHVFVSFRISGSGFAFVFVSVGVRLTCGIPTANFWTRTTCDKLAVKKMLAPLHTLLSNQGTTVAKVGNPGRALGGTMPLEPPAVVTNR